MRYIITTLGRIRQQETLRNLPDSVADHVELWVQEHEYENSCLYYDGVHCLPAHITNLGATRQHLLDLYRGEKIVLMDDDLTFYWRANPPDWHLTTPPAAELERMFAEIEAHLDTYAHVGVSGREGQSHEPSPHVESTRYMRVLCYNTAMFPQHVRMDRLDGMSDFDTNLQLLRAGLPSLVLTDFAQGQRWTQAPGGCSLNRTHETHAREVRSLCELHPGLVTPRKKANRSGGDFGERDEVTIMWKEALTWSRSTRQASLLEVALERAEISDCVNGELRSRIGELERLLDDQAADTYALSSDLAIAQSRIAELEEQLAVIPVPDLRKRKLSVAAEKPRRRSRAKSPEPTIVEDESQQPLL